MQRLEENRLEVSGEKAFVREIRSKIKLPAVTLYTGSMIDFVALIDGREEEDFCEIVEEDFFDIGGSSILAMKVVIAAEKKGYAIFYNDIFSNTTPRRLATFTGGGTKKVTINIKSDTSAQINEIGKDEKSSLRFFIL